MMHKLQMYEEDSRLFDVLYEGFISTAKPASREEHAAVAGILRKLRRMSKELDSVIPMYSPSDPLSPRRRKLIPDAFELFEEGEWNYLVKAMNGAQTLPIISELMVSLFDKFDTAPKGDAKEFLLKQQEESGIKKESA